MGTADFGFDRTISRIRHPMSRDDAAASFLATAGWQTATVAPIPGDASARRYHRLHHTTLGNAILMDAPPDAGQRTAPFVHIAQHLTSIGLSAPQIFAWNEQDGFLLLEDFGKDLIADLSEKRPTIAPDLYRAAVDVLVALHRHAPPAGVVPYNTEMMGELAGLSVTWYARGADGHTSPNHAGALEIAARVADLLQRHAPDQSALILRDYHAENLFWLPDRPVPARIGLIDFQDAMTGHPGYDLMSLLKDARRDVPEDLRRAMVRHYLDATGRDEDPFYAACAILSAQRNLRILGGFARLSLHFDKPRYVDLIPRVWSHLQSDLAHPALQSLRSPVAALLPSPSEARRARLKEARGTCPNLIP